MTTEIFTGRVKWFNNKTGYGFITITDGQRSGSDIFVHHSAIDVEGQYKYLVQGEYVEFSIVNTASEKHDSQAANVKGIKGGKMMCETRHENKIARTNYKKETESSSKPNFRKVLTGQDASVVAEPKQEKPQRQEKPQKQRKPVSTSASTSEVKQDDEEWTKVKSKKTTATKPRGRPAKKQESK
jgi:CspA family cold shock protein